LRPLTKDVRVKRKFIDTMGIDKKIGLTT